MIVIFFSMFTVCLICDSVCFLVRFRPVPEHILDPVDRGHYEVKNDKRRGDKRRRV